MHTELHPTAIHTMRCASIGLSVRVYLNFEVFGSVMVAGWSNEATKSLLTVWGVQNIQNQLDGVVRNKVVYVRVPTTLQECGYEFSWKQCTYFRHFVSVMQPNDAKQKKQRFF